MQRLEDSLFRVVDAVNIRLWWLMYTARPRAGTGVQVDSPGAEEGDLPGDQEEDKGEDKKQGERGGPGCSRTGGCCGGSTVLGVRHEIWHHLKMGQYGPAQELACNTLCCADGPKEYAQHAPHDACQAGSEQDNEWRQGSKERFARRAERVARWKGQQGDYQSASQEARQAVVDERREGLGDGQHRG